MWLWLERASLMAQTVKNPPAMREIWVWSLGWEDLLAEGMVTHASILAWRIPMDRGAWRLQSVKSQRVDVTECLNTAHHQSECRKPSRGESCHCETPGRMGSQPERAFSLFMDKRSKQGKLLRVNPQGHAERSRGEEQSFCLVVSFLRKANTVFVQINFHSFHWDPISGVSIVCRIIWQLFWFELASDV